MKEILKRAVSLGPGEYTDALFEEQHNLEITFVGDRLDSVNSTTVNGGRVAALNRGGYAATSFTDPEGIDHAVSRSHKAAAALSRFGDGYRQAPVPAVKDDVRPSPVIDPRGRSFDEKVALARHYAKLMLSSEKVKTCRALYQETLTRKTFVNSEGSEITQDILFCRVGGRIFAQKGGATESIGYSFGYDEDYAKLEGREAEVEDKVKVAVDLLSADPVVGGAYEVVCDADLAGVFVHEAFGHLSESDDVINNPSLEGVVKLGKKVGSGILDIFDQGNLKGAPGTYAYDDEGVATRRTYLVRNGILEGRLYSRMGAMSLGSEPTGNFRALDYRFMPIVRMSNICIGEGETDFDEMIGSIGTGFYLKGGKGGQTMGDLFTFGAQYGYEIKNGRLGKMVKNINISGNVFETLGNIVMIGNDFKVSEWGGCGKTRAALYDMQMLDKSGLASPSVKIRDVVIGG